MARYTVTLGGREQELGPISGLVALALGLPAIVLCLVACVLVIPAVLVAYPLARLGL